MGKITESDIELYAIEELEHLGFQFLHGPDISPDGVPDTYRTPFQAVVGGGS